MGDVLDYFIRQTSESFIEKLCGPHYCPVPIVKTCYYTTVFILKKLCLQKEDVDCKPKTEDRWKRKQEELLNLDIAHTLKCIDKSKDSQRSEKRRPLYSYFFSTTQSPSPDNLQDLIVRLIENFMTTYLNGRPTDRMKHFFKVIAFERTAIEKASEITVVRWPTSAGSQQSPNSKEFLEKIKYEKVSNIGNISLTGSDRKTRNESLVVDCQREALAIWNEQCFNYCVKNKADCSCSFKELEQYDTTKLNQGTISLKLSSDRQKIVYTLQARSSKGKAEREVPVENSVIIRSCSFELSVTEKAGVKLTIGLNEQGDLASSHFPIHVEEVVGTKVLSSNVDSDACSKLIYFCEALKIILATYSQQMLIKSPFNSTNSDSEKICKKLERRPMLLQNISELLYDTRTFPLNCLPFEKAHTSPPPLPPLPSSLPKLEQNSCDL